LRIATVGGDDDAAGWGAWLSDSGLLGPDNAGRTTPGAAEYRAHYGTSFAAPLVSGTLGLMLAIHPRLSAAELLEGLAASARPHVHSPLLPACGPAHPGRCACSAARCGAGILDATQALAYAQARAEGRAYQAPNWPWVEIDTPELRQAVATGPDREAASGQPPEAAEGGGATTPAAAAALLLAALLLPLRGRRAASGSRSAGR
jgi:serine protease